LQQDHVALSSNKYTAKDYSSADKTLTLDNARQTPIDESLECLVRFRTWIPEEVI